MKMLFYDFLVWCPLLLALLVGIMSVNRGRGKAVVVCVAAAFLGLLFVTSQPDVAFTPTCEGKLMSPGDTCQVFRGATLVSTKSYATMVKDQRQFEGMHRAFLYVSVGSSLIAIILVVKRRDLEDAI
jgi:hypothetical protein